MMSRLSISTYSNATTITKAVYDDFAAPTLCRTSKLIVEDRVLYVNAGWLAELSPYFAMTYFGEKLVNEVHLPSPDFRYDDVLELMRVIFYCPTRKPITETNLVAVFTLASRFEMRPVMERCENIVVRRIGVMSRQRLFQLACSIAKYDRHSDAMVAIVDKLSNMSGHELSTLQFSQVPGDVVADVYAAKMKRREMKRCCLWPF